MNASHPDDHTTRPADTARPGRSRTATTILLVGFVLVSLNSRVPFGQLGPLAPIAGLDATLVTVLGVLPPLGMGLGAPLAPMLLRHRPDDRLLVWASAAALAGAAIRPVGTVGLVGGTLLAALAIGVVNVLVPVYVRHRFDRRRRGAVFGAYALAMGLGSALAAAVTVPVAEASGDVRLAIATAIVPALAAALGSQLMRSTPSPGVPLTEPRSAGRTPGGRTPSTSDATPRPHIARTWLAWSLTSFFALQSLVFYALLAWTPSVLVAAGFDRATAGTGQTVLIVGIALGGLGAPLAASPRTHQTAIMWIMCGLCAIGLTGLAFAPTLALGLWLPLLGLGLGGGQALPAVLYAHRGTDGSHTAALSSFAQAGGFVIAAAGPVLLPAGERLTGSWLLPLLLLAALCLLNVPLSHRGALATRAA
ncbi:MFS transporter [Pseudoclavibacter chungangensis]|uniref:MFS transporter n=1 Tax=Pseudoclavibacter chungangensis TaxID=587635 RepID=A0A7J5BMF5_9MICO|nr:MFS transporter [Pseudoclavibacter chungangensis]KAB1652089.1 MFS transporter [Pseudoclavibacter chungangensis]NYJ65985.1 CP family cyanate transporter-like MFS transporter [Pseudoclavibacter chungangensis]